MCTLSIIPYNGNLIVTMNRDERRDRSEAQGLRIETDFSYPCDAETGGTWFGINRHGMIMALLNRYDAPYKPKSLSRGRFIPELLQSHDIEAALSIFEKRQVEQDNPFDLFLISSKQSVHIRWNGVSQSKNRLFLDEPLIFTSSSENQEAVLPFRQVLFSGFIRETWPDKTTPDKIFHHLHLKAMPDNTSSAIFMRRALTHTKSIVQAVLSDSNITATYWTEEQIRKIAYEVAGDADMRPSHAQFPLALSVWGSARKDMPHINPN